MTVRIHPLPELPAAKTKRKAGRAAGALKVKPTLPIDAPIKIRSSSRAALSWSGRAMDFRALYRADPLDRVLLIKQGVPASSVEFIATRMDLTKEQLFKTLGLSRATVDRKAGAGKALTADESSRVLGMARLVGQVQAMVEESGNPQGFDAAQWVAQWLNRPLPAFGGRRPAELMDTPDGQAMVSQWVARMASGAYS